MKNFFFVIILLLLLSSCAKKESSESNNNGSVVNTEYVVVNLDVLKATYHKQFGSCQALPITHRLLSFAPFFLERANDDIFIGVLEIILTESTSTYRALYREMPGVSNVDQVIYSDVIEGSFELDSNAKKIILHNLGEVYAHIFSNRVEYVIQLDSDLNRPLRHNEIRGRIELHQTSLIADNCLP